MAAFNILDHLDKLEPDGGSNDPRGDHSYLCPVCGSNNFKVNIRTGKWGAYGCDCSSTENGKRKIRDALSPAVAPDGGNPTTKQVRPEQRRSWDYFTPVTLAHKTPALTVHRIDDGRGKRKIWQESLIDGHGAAEVKEKVLPYGLAEAQQALADGAPYVFWVEGEPCVDALRALGLFAVTSIGGAGKFKPERDAGHLPADRLVVVPDRDKPGMAHMEAVADEHPGCQWLLPFPGTAEWNGSMPSTGGVDIADWITSGATVDLILSGIGPKQEKKQPRQVDDDDDIPLDEFITEKVGELLDLRLTTSDTWAKEMALIAELGWRGLKRPDIENRMYAALADRWHLAIRQSHAKRRRGRSPNQTREGEQQQMLVHGFLPWKRDAVLFGPGGVGKTTAAVRIAWSAITGEPFLDHEIPSEITGRVLFIGSDGGTGAYDMFQNTAEDLGISNDPRWEAGIDFWGADEQEGIGAWSVTPAGLQELKTELEEGDYALVIIDSWKAVLELAGIDFGIGPVGTIVRLIQALIGQHCSALYLHHPSGNTKGKGIGGAGGNQNINQIPYAVHELRVEPVSDDRPKCVRWIAHKLRGYVSREFLYRLTPDGFQIVEGEVVRNCRDDLIITISDLEQMGTATTTHAIQNLLTNRNEATVGNNLTKLRQDGYLKKTGASWHLTTKGKRTVTALTRGE